MSLIDTVVLSGRLHLNLFSNPVQVDGGELTFEVPHPPVPFEIANFLMSRDWRYDAKDHRYSNGSHTDMRWDEAMAIEFYKFITLGGR